MRPSPSWKRLPARAGSPPGRGLFSHGRPCPSGASRPSWHHVHLRRPARGLREPWRSPVGGWAEAVVRVEGLMTAVVGRRLPISGRHDHRLQDVLGVPARLDEVDGERVLDLGSGSGLDSFVAAQCSARSAAENRRIRSTVMRASPRPPGRGAATRSRAPAPGPPRCPRRRIPFARHDRRSV